MRAAYIDPLPQALVLTAIVISFGMTAVVVVMALRALPRDRQRPRRPARRASPGRQDWKRRRNGPGPARRGGERA